VAHLRHDVVVPQKRGSAETKLEAQQGWAKTCSPEIRQKMISNTDRDFARRSSDLTALLAGRREDSASLLRRWPRPHRRAVRAPATPREAWLKFPAFPVLFAIWAVWAELGRLHQFLGELLVLERRAKPPIEPFAGMRWLANGLPKKAYRIAEVSTNGSALTARCGPQRTRCGKAVNQTRHTTRFMVRDAFAAGDCPGRKIGERMGVRSRHQGFSPSQQEWLGQEHVTAFFLRATRLAEGPRQLVSHRFKWSDRRARALRLMRTEEARTVLRGEGRARRSIHARAVRVVRRVSRTPRPGYRRRFARKRVGEHAVRHIAATRQHGKGRLNAERLEIWASRRVPLPTRSPPLFSLLHG